MRYPPPPNAFAPTPCVCGLVAKHKYRVDYGLKVYEVDVECDHGGKPRSETPPFKATIKFREEDVYNHDQQNQPIAVFGGSPLGDGKTWRPRPVLSPSGVSVGAAASAFQGINRTEAAAGLVGRDGKPIVGDRPRRTFPCEVKWGEVEAGDVIEGPLYRPGSDIKNPDVLLGRRELAVVLSVRLRMAGAEVAKVTFRRIKDGVYASSERDAKMLVKAIADAATTGGDPDRWVSAIDDVKAAPEPTAAEDPVAKIQALQAAVRVGAISAVKFKNAVAALGILLRESGNQAAAAQLLHEVTSRPQTAYAFKVGDVVEVETKRGVDRAIVTHADTVGQLQGRRVLQAKWTAGPYAGRTTSFELGVDSVRLVTDTP